MTWQIHINTAKLTSTPSFPDSLIARMTKQSIADVGGPWVDEEQRWGLPDGHPGGPHLRLSYRVTCAPHYYGIGCEVLCRPRDDAFGHYTCSAAGEIVCRPGWTGDYCSKRKCFLCSAVKGSFVLVQVSKDLFFTSSSKPQNDSAQDTDTGILLCNLHYNHDRFHGLTYSNRRTSIKLMRFKACFTRQLNGSWSTFKLENKLPVWTPVPIYHRA